METRFQKRRKLSLKARNMANKIENFKNLAIIRLLMTDDFHPRLM